MRPCHKYKTIQMDINQKKNDPHAGFYSRLAKLIRESPHTQKEICSQTGISPSRLAKYKKNRVPKADELFKLARFFGVRMEWLLKEEGLRGAAEAMDKSDLFFGKERVCP